MSKRCVTCCHLGVANFKYRDETAPRPKNWQRNIDAAQGLGLPRPVWKGQLRSHSHPVCRKNPPVAAQPTETEFGPATQPVWPMVEPLSDWCSQHEETEE